MTLYCTTNLVFLFLRCPAEMAFIITKRRIESSDADDCSIPIVLYSVPQFTGLALEAAVVARLAGHANIIGIKESSGNVQRVTEIIQATPPEFQTLVGSATTLYPA